MLRTLLKWAATSTHAVMLTGPLYPNLTTRCPSRAYLFCITNYWSCFHRIYNPSITCSRYSCHTLVLSSMYHFDEVEILIS